MQTEFSHLGQKWAHYKITILQDHIADRILSFETKMGTLQNYNTTSSNCRQNSVKWDKNGHIVKSLYYKIILQTEFSPLGQKWAHSKITILLADIADRIQSLGLKWIQFQISTLQDHFAD